MSDSLESQIDCVECGFHIDTLLDIRGDSTYCDRIDLK